MHGSCTCKEATSSLFPKDLLRVQGYHLVWNGLNKMNDHTQGGDVQIVKLIQFMSCFQVDAKDKSKLGLSSMIKKEQAPCPDLQASTTLTNQCKTTHNSNRQRQQCSHSKDARSTKFSDQHQQTRRGRVYVRGLKLYSLLSPNSQPWTCKGRVQRQ